MNAPPQWLRITQALITSMEGLEHLDTGEAEAILLTAATGGRLIVMDDRAGVAAAGKRGLRTIGTIGVLDAAARHGITDLATALDKLGKTTFRMPKRIRQLLITGAS
jgi:predicted nucleic acid-binding protein